MLLRNLFIAGREGFHDISVEGDRICAVNPAGSSADEEGIDLCSAMAFPGLINSHDHLDFNLFPALRNRIYASYREWGRDIHAKNDAEIRAVLKIPQPLRAGWGAYKNLFNGVTTVVHHGEKIETDALPVSIVRDCTVLHSVGFEKAWRWKLNRARGDLPVVMHVGEGTDPQSRNEIDSLLRWNFFRKDIIAVHGVAMECRQAKHFRALVWCPASNYFSLGATAQIDTLKKNIVILFGTDSTLTAGWNIWEHLRTALQTGMMNERELLQSLTAGAASVWQLNDRGKIEAGKKADLVIMENTAAENQGAGIFRYNPEDILLVMHHGRPVLFDASWHLFFHDKTGAIFSKLYINGRCKYVQGDLPALVTAIRQYHPDICFPVSLTPADRDCR